MNYMVSSGKEGQRRFLMQMGALEHFEIYVRKILMAYPSTILELRKLRENLQHEWKYQIPEDVYSEYLTDLVFDVVQFGGDYRKIIEQKNPDLAGYKDLSACFYILEVLCESNYEKIKELAAGLPKGLHYSLSDLSICNDLYRIYHYWEFFVYREPGLFDEVFYAEDGEKFVADLPCRIPARIQRPGDNDYLIVRRDVDFDGKFSDVDGDGEVFKFELYVSSRSDLDKISRGFGWDLNSALLSSGVHLARVEYSGGNKLGEGVLNAYDSYVKSRKKIPINALTVFLRGAICWDECQEIKSSQGGKNGFVEKAIDNMLAKFISMGVQIRGGDIRGDIRKDYNRLKNRLK